MGESQLILKKLCFLLLLIVSLPQFCIGCSSNRNSSPSENAAQTQTPEPASSVTAEPSVQIEATVPPSTSPAAKLPEPAESLTPATPEIAVEEPEDSAFVRVADYIPAVVIDLKYATEDNFTGVVIYDFEDAYLRYGTVKKLAKVQSELAEKGYGIKIWDAFRPVAAQFVLWDTVPDSRYVANPHSGYSPHSRGNTVDITLVDSDGNECEMPTGFDDFSALADRDYSDISKNAASNARLLESVMTTHGFKGYSNEWWHYKDNTSYEVEKSFTPELAGQ